jgi:hypothetical protein
MKTFVVAFSLLLATLTAGAAIAVAMANPAAANCIARDCS